MVGNKIGKIVRFLREKKGVSIKKLSRGLCSETVLIRLENGERIPDGGIVERILGRLGKSMNQIELMTTKSEYNIICMQMEIEEMLEQSEWDKANCILNGYELHMKGNIQQQYYWRTKAILAKQNKEYTVAERNLKKAICCTVPQFCMEDMGEYCLAGEEILLILMWIEQKYLLGIGNLERDCYIVLDYILNNFTDEEAVLIIFPKTVYMLVNQLIVKGERKEALRWSEQAKKMMVSNGIAHYVYQFLEIEEKILIGEKGKEEYQRVARQKASLGGLYKRFGFVSEERDELWKSSHQYDLYLISEAVEQERKSMRKTQEEIAEKARIDQKTVSRVENGIYVPKLGTLERLKNALGMKRERYNPRLETDNFVCLEIQRKIAKQQAFHRYSEARNLLAQLTDMIDTENKENKQFLLYVQISLDREEGKISAEEAIKRSREAFALTRKEHIEEISGVILGKYEVMIANYVARQYAILNEKQHAVIILENLLKGYENSKVDTRYHYAEVSVIYTHLSCYYENLNNYEMAEIYCKKGIRLDIICGRLQNIGYLLMQYGYICERKKEKKEVCQKIYRASYYLFELVEDDYYMQILKTHFASVYHMDI